LPRRKPFSRRLTRLKWVNPSRPHRRDYSRNSLARALFIHRLGEIRDRTYENQQHRAAGLNLLVTAIILWKTRYLEHAVATLCQVEGFCQTSRHLRVCGGKRSAFLG
jgi:hypothetical protein